MDGVEADPHIGELPMEESSGQEISCALPSNDIDSFKLDLCLGLMLMHPQEPRFIDVYSISLLTWLRTAKDWQELYDRRLKLFAIYEVVCGTGSPVDALISILDQRHPTVFKLESRSGYLRNVTMAMLRNHCRCSINHFIRGNLPWVISVDCDDKVVDVIAEFLMGNPINFFDLEMKHLKSVLGFATTYSCEDLFRGALVALVPGINQTVAQDCFLSFPNFGSVASMAEFLTDIQEEKRSDFDSWSRGETVPFWKLSEDTVVFVSKEMLNRHLNIYFSKNSFAALNSKPDAQKVDTGPVPFDSESFSRNYERNLRLLLEYLNTKNLNSLTADPAVVRSLMDVAVYVEYEELYLQTYDWLVTEGSCSINDLAYIFGHQFATFEVRECLQGGRSLFVTLRAMDGSLFRVHKQKLSECSGVFRDLIEFYPQEQTLDTVCKDKGALENLVRFVHFNEVTRPTMDSWETRVDHLIHLITLYDYYHVSDAMLTEILSHLTLLVNRNTVLTIYEKIPFHLDQAEMWNFIYTIHKNSDYLDLIYKSPGFLLCPTEIFLSTLASCGVDRRARLFNHVIHRRTFSYAKPRTEYMLGNHQIEHIRKLKPFLASQSPRVAALEEMADEITEDTHLFTSWEEDDVSLDQHVKLNNYLVVLCELSMKTLLPLQTFQINFFCYDEQLNLSRFCQVFGKESFMPKSPKVFWKDRSLIAVDEELHVTVIHGDSCRKYRHNILTEDMCVDSSGILGESGDIVACCVNKTSQENTIYRLNLETYDWVDVSPIELTLRGKPFGAGGRLYVCYPGDWILLPVRNATGEFGVHVTESVCADLPIRDTFGILETDGRFLFFLQHRVLVIAGPDEGFRTVEEHPIEAVGVRTPGDGYWHEAKYSHGRILLVHIKDGVKRVYRLDPNTWQLEMVVGTMDVQSRIPLQYLSLEFL